MISCTLVPNQLIRNPWTDQVLADYVLHKWIFRKSGYPKIRQSGNREIRISGIPDFRVSRNPDIRISGNLDFRIFRISGYSGYCGCQDIPEYPDIREVWNSGNPDFGIPISENPDFRISGNPKISLRITYQRAEYVLDRIDLAIRITYYVLSLPGPVFTRVQHTESHFMGCCLELQCCISLHHVWPLAAPRDGSQTICTLVN